MKRILLITVNVCASNGRFHISVIKMCTNPFTALPIYYPYLASAVQKLARFWHTYENLNLKIAFVLISLQLIHLYWLTTDVVVKRISGNSAFGLSQTNPCSFFS
jgi:hypothetical protein